jgi:hypothetical protein
MTTFRITYRAERGAPAQACTIEAIDYYAALRALGRVYSIVRASQRCEGQTPDGQCRAWTHTTLCHNHNTED